VSAVELKARSQTETLRMMIEARMKDGHHVGLRELAMLQHLQAWVAQVEARLAMLEGRKR
jgi:hypothetical protein